jgi:hypothetical protein
MVSHLDESQYIGVLPDNRTAKEKEKDWQAEELVSAGSTVPKFRKVKKGKWKKYTLRDQDGSGSCVSQALAKGFEVLYKKQTGKTIQFSSTPIYQKRQNKPHAGMYIHDAFSIAVKYGTCPEKNCPSQKMNDEQMDLIVMPTDFENINNFINAISYVAMPKDFDFIAAWVEQNGFAQIHIAADRKSWSQDFPQLGSQNRGIRHAVAVVDAVTYEKVQYLVLDDSWGRFGEFSGQRLISREVFNDMFTSGAGFTLLKYDVSDTKFTRFENILEYGQKNDEVVRLQDFLKARGFFPANQNSTGYYGNVTALAVYNYQIANRVASPVELNLLKGKRVGIKTLKSINTQL